MTDFVEYEGIRFEGEQFAELTYSSLKGWDGVPESRGSGDPIPGANGSFGRARVLRESVALVLTANIIADSEARFFELKRRIEAMPAIGMLRVDQGDGVWSRRVEVQHVDIPDFHKRTSAQFTVEFLAPDPLRYRDPVTLGPVGLPVRGRPGVPPVVVDVNWGPSFHGPTTPVEVRRNIALNPRASSTASFSATGAPSTLIAVSAGGLDVGGFGVDTFVRAEATGAGTYLDVRTGTASGSVSGGQVVPVSAWVRRSAGLSPSSYTLYVQHLSASGSVLTTSTWDVPVAGDAVFARVSGVVTMHADAVRLNFIVRANVGVASGNRLDMSAVCIGWDGYSDSTFSPDPDLTAELVPSGGGASRLMGRHLEALTDTRCVSFLTADNSEIRVLPTSTDNNSYTELQFPIAAGARGGGVFSAVGRMDAPLTGSLHALARRVRTLFPDTYPLAFPNAAGTYPVSHSYGAMTGTYRALLMHGGTLGSGEVRWSKVGLYGPDSPGEYFGIETPQVAQGDGIVYTRWQGGVVGAPVEKVYEVPADGAGLEFPAAFPWNFGYSTTPTATIANGGSTPVYPVVTIVGKSDGVTVNIGPRRIQYGPFDGTLTIDCLNRRAYLNGVDVTRQLIRREWAAIPPGDTWDVTHAHDNPTDGTYMTVEYQIGAW